MFFEVFSFSGLQVEPRVRKRSDVRQKCFDEGMKFILKKLQRRVGVTETINKKPPETGLSRGAKARRDGDHREGAYTFFGPRDSYPSPTDPDPAASPLHLAPTQNPCSPPHTPRRKTGSSFKQAPGQRRCNDGALSPHPQISLKKKTKTKNKQTQPAGLWIRRTNR